MCLGNLEEYSYHLCVEQGRFEGQKGQAEADPLQSEEEFAVRWHSAPTYLNLMSHSDGWDNDLLHTLPYSAVRSEDWIVDHIHLRWWDK